MFLPEPRESARVTSEFESLQTSAASLFIDLTHHVSVLRVPAHQNFALLSLHYGYDLDCDRFLKSYYRFALMLNVKVFIYASIRDNKPEVDAQ